MLSWNAPASDNGSPITGYHIYRRNYSDTPTTYKLLVEDTQSTSTTYSDSTVEGRTNYRFYVRAINSAGKGNARYVKIWTREPGIADPPTGLSASEQTFGTVVLSWTAPARDGGNAITGYRIHRANYSDTPTTYSPLTASTGSTSTTYSDSTVSESSRYRYFVGAVNSAGTGRSDQVSISTRRAGVPLTPTSLTASEETLGTVKLSWTAPSSDGGSPITGYKIIRTNNSVSPAAHDTLTESAPSTSTSYVDSGVSGGTWYTYKMYSLSLLRDLVQGLAVFGSVSHARMIIYTTKGV